MCSDNTVAKVVERGSQQDIAAEQRLDAGFSDVSPGSTGVRWPWLNFLLIARRSFALMDSRYGDISLPTVGSQSQGTRSLSTSLGNTSQFSVATPREQQAAGLLLLPSLKRARFCVVLHRCIVDFNCARVAAVCFRS